MDERTLDWVASLVSDVGRPVSDRRLTGGTSSDVFAVEVQASGRHDTVVVRRYPDGDPEGLVSWEAQALSGMRDTGLEVPDLVGADPFGAQTGLPTLVMTQMPGEIELNPQDMDSWLDQMAAMLVRIHGCDVPARPFEKWLRDEDLVVPSWTAQPEVWQEAFDIVARGPDEDADSFIHGDYQHFNILWTGSRLTAVVDWVNAFRGAPDRDVGHCRLNLTLLYSPDVAEDFRRRWEAHAGRKLDRYWDVYSLVSHLPGGQWGNLEKQIDGHRVLDHGGLDLRVEKLLMGG